MPQTSDTGPFRLFDTDGETVAEITTDGATLKPFVNAVRQVVDECRVHFEPDGLRVTAVEPSNVLMINAHLPADAFERYALPNGDDRAIGVNVASFRHAIRRARMGHDDTLELRVAERRLYAHVDRAYDDGTTLVTEDQTDLIDPNSIRMEPEIPDLPLTELALSHEAFVDATEYADADFSDYIEYTVVDGELHVSTKGDTAASKARLAGVASPDTDGLHGLYSSDFLRTVLDAVGKAKADGVTVELGDAFPLRVSFERTDADGEVTLRGETLLAPRVRKDDKPEGDA